MLRKVLLGSTALAVATLFAGTEVRAADAQGQGFSLSGTVANTCTLGSFSEVSSSNVTVGASGTTFDITLDSAGNDAVADPFSAEVAADAMCNFNANVKLTTQNGGMTLGGVAQSSLTAPPANFANLVEYQATVNWASANIGTLDTNNGAEGYNSSWPVGATNGSLSLTIADSNLPADPLLAGTYEDTLTLDIGNV